MFHPRSNYQHVKVNKRIIKLFFGSIYITSDKKARVTNSLSKTSKIIHGILNSEHNKQKAKIILFLNTVGGAKNLQRRRQCEWTLGIPYIPRNLFGHDDRVYEP